MTEIMPGIQVFTDCRVPPMAFIMVPDTSSLTGPRTCTDTDPCDQHKPLTPAQAAARLNTLWGYTLDNPNLRDLTGAVQHTEEHVAVLRDAVARLRRQVEDGRKGRSKWDPGDITGEFP